MTRTDGMVWALAFGLVPMIVGCGDDGGGPSGEADSGPAATADAGGGHDAGEEAACWEPPGTGYGSSVGKKLEPFTLQNCADGSDYSFYNEEYCDTTLTVISIAAGWCPPCIEESRQLTDVVTEAYRGRGVRVIQVLVQDQNYRAPTLEYCQTWVARFGLTNVEVIDPTGVTQIYFPGNSLPSTIIVDSEGTIRFRENGATEGLISLTSKLDSLLAEMGL